MAVVPRFAWYQSWYVEKLDYAAVTDPGGSAKGAQKAMRGGSYSGYAMAVRASSRGGHMPIPDPSYLQQIGVRCVRLIK